ncbi:hypothetical protein SDRG_10484 [Saprolegnia diclina VS20]|uniref:DUF4436 domain-containing protein n=1 Tax=Saprolegnia diclina (strain VS20) TaxID=1156394 RepID=T0QEK1_SAPDV|nr:hypothetical protein SDRG_10484 [Saprolegnia diclina VS20]EQC31970.1 hypothetical protein SDRG_10484 [Saprolegnia diclina VS20]|eukprot:XP_008614698.1 hypothetical protein SDRG_10484 [Saprolegnia diclina VS20]
MTKDVELGFDEVGSPTSASSSSHSHRPIDRRWLFEGLFVLTIVGILLLTIIPTLLLNYERTAYTLLHKDVADDTALPIAMVLSGVNTDTNQISAQLFLDGTLPSSLTSTEHPRQLARALNLNINGNAVTLSPAMNLAAGISQQVTLSSGSIIMFPFDKYTAPLSAHATTTSPVTNASVTLPVRLAIYTTTDFNWKYAVVTGDDLVGPGANGPLGRLVIETYRHPLFFSYIIVMWLGIWVVGLSLAYIASTTIIWNRKPVENPMVYFSGLIVIPIFRNTAPGHAPYGCLFDMTSTYLALAIAAIGMLFATIISMNKTH